MIQCFIFLLLLFFFNSELGEDTDSCMQTVILPSSMECDLAIVWLKSKICHNVSMIKTFSSYCKFS